MKKLLLTKEKIKWILFVSILSIFFLCVIWWIFSSGKDQSSQSKRSGGLNTQLPSAKNAVNATTDKISMYAAAAADSGKRREQIRMDPYRQLSERILHHPKGDALVYTSHFGATDAMQTNIAAIQRRLAETTQPADEYFRNEPETRSVEIERSAKAPLIDPELDAINGTLDKLIAIQRPQLPTVTAEGSRYAIRAGGGVDTSYFGKTKQDKSREAFYEESKRPSQKSSTIMAMITQDQLVQNGSVLKLELCTAISVGEINLPAGTPLFGLVDLQAERLRVHISTIQYHHTILPVSLDVVDMDGLEGLYAPGSSMTDWAKESAGGAIQSADPGVSGFSLSSRIAAAGIGAAKNLFSRKVKQVRMIVAGGYRVLLRYQQSMRN